MILSEAIEEFIRWKMVKKQVYKSYFMNLRQFCIFMRDCHIEEVKLKDIIEWFELQEKVKYDNNTFIPRAIAIKKLLEFWQKQGFQVLNCDLVPIPEKSYSKARVASEEQFNKILRAIPLNNDPRHIRNKAIIRMFWDTGARNGEICSLNLADLDLKEMKAVIRTEKAKHFKPFREIFWTKPTNEDLKRWIDKREYLQKKAEFKHPEALWISIAAKTGERFTIKGVGEMLRRYSHKANLPIINPHSFRHHLGHELANKGANNSVISNILGHSSLQSSFTYTQLNNKELKDIYRKFKEKE